MRHISSEEVRSLRQSFWEKKNHTALPEASLIADKESTAMFNLAGMQQLIPFLAGKKYPLGSKLYNIQKCVRTVDIDEVGDQSHLTMFEMMGNRSLGDYFKEQSIRRSWEFLTHKDYLSIDPKYLAVTVFAGDDNAPRDEESANYWKEAGVSPDRISYLGVEDNRRSPGPVGPCGPDTEIFYRVGEGEPHGNVGDNEDDWMEIWNNVFMEYYREESGNLKKLANQNVDTGMGLERLCMVLQGKDSPYETDLLFDIVRNVYMHTNASPKNDQSLHRVRIISDHLRTSVFLINQDLRPSNEGKGYVLRMIIRRMYYNFSLLHSDNHINFDFKRFLENSIDFIDRKYSPKTNLITKEIYKDLIKKDIIADVIIKEIQSFQKTITKGEKLLQSILHQSDTMIAGKDIFTLYDTHGFPVELTREIVQEAGKQLDMDGFYQAMDAQKQRSRKNMSKKFVLDIDRSQYLEGLITTEFIGHETHDYSDMTLLKDFEVNGQRILVFDKTPFYAEGGGQKGDYGTVELDRGEVLTVTDVQKYEGVYLHFVQ